MNTWETNLFLLLNLNLNRGALAALCSERTNLAVTAEWMKTTVKECFHLLSGPYFGWKIGPNLQLNSIQPQLYPVNISLWRFPLIFPRATLWNLLICIPIRESLSVFVPWLLGKGKAVCVASCTYTLIQFHCADAEEARPAVSAFPWAKLLCRCPLKHGDENKKLLWSKHLLCYSSSSVAGAHIAPVPAVNHLPDTDEFIFHIKLD